MQLWLIVPLVLIVWYILRVRKPRLYYNKDGQIARILSRMKSIHQFYFPTPWLIGKDFHTIWGMQYRKHSSVKQEREIFKFEDGGSIPLDYMLPEKVPENPIVIIVMHTMGGGSREPCVNNLCEALYKKGMIPVITGARGSSGCPWTNEKFSTGIDFSEINQVAAYLKEKYHPSHMFLAGFSATAFTSIAYAAKFKNFEAVAAISHCLDAMGSQRMLLKGLGPKLYSPFMLSKLKHWLSKNQYVKDEIKQEANKTKRLIDFDRIVCAPQLGMTVEEYYHAIDIKDKLDNLKCPALVLVSKDDPFADLSAAPYDEAKRCDKGLYVETNEGGHVSFLTGLSGNKSLIDKIVPEFFEAVIYDHKYFIL